MSRRGVAMSDDDNDRLERVLHDEMYSKSGINSNARGLCLVLYLGAIGKTLICLEGGT